MTQKFPHERRRHARLEQRHMLYHEKYVFGMSDDKEILEKGTIKNYSLGGTLFESTVQYEPGDILRLAISIPGWEKYKNQFYKDKKSPDLKPVVIMARVLRVQTLVRDEIYDIAVEFIGIDEGDRWTLMKHIKDQMEKKDKD